MDMLELEDEGGGGCLFKGGMFTTLYVSAGVLVIHGFYPLPAHKQVQILTL